MKALKLIILMTTLSLCSACAANRFALRPNDSSADSIVMENTNNPGKLYIIVKGQHALDETLDRLKCRKQPCMIGRVGEVYIVERPKVE